MIISFKSKIADELFHDERPKKFSSQLASVAQRKLYLIHAAQKVEDLRVPPGNRLESLKGSRQGQYSIRINDQWRICFYFKNGQASEVEIVDYH